MQVPMTCQNGKDQAKEIQDSEIEEGVPGKCVTHAPVERIRLIFAEAKYIRTGLHARQLSEHPGNTRPDQDRAQPEKISSATAMGKQIKRERTRGKKKNPDPDGPVRYPVIGLVSLADFAFVGVFNFNGIGHPGTDRSI